jgi:transposase
MCAGERCRQGEGRPTLIGLDSASIYHSIAQATLDFRFIEDEALLFYLPPYSPELNLIEIVWKHFKYHWRRFVTWTKETRTRQASKRVWHQITSQFPVNT